MAMLLVTHNFGVVADLCDRVTVMQNGLIVETGPVRAIFQRPEHPYTQSLLGAILDEGPARPPLAHRRHRTRGRHRMSDGTARPSTTSSSSTPARGSAPSRSRR